LEEAGTCLIQVILSTGLRPPLWLSQVLNAVPMLLHIPGLPGKVFSAQKAFMALLDELMTKHRMT
jgi:hypothetical protein